MGFFSSRKYNLAVEESDHPVVHIVRSRFYGKGKEKSQSSLPRDHDRPSIDVHGRLPSNGINDISHHHLHRSPASARSSSDAITMTLAQRLNELAVANEQGLLDDDEYRLLRQNLFERFASSSTTPTEAPIIRLSGHSRNHSGNVGATNASTRPESLQSKPSVTASLSGLFRRATSRRSLAGSSIHSSSDSMSIISVSSARPKSRSFAARAIGGQSSRTSLQSETSPSPEALAAQESDATVRRSITPNGKRQAHNAPPSAFSPRGIRVTAKHTQSLDAVNGHYNAQSVQEIRQEIEAVEAEGRRLLDAFNGLELSTLTRSQRRPPGSIPISNSSIFGDSDTMSINSGGSAAISTKLSTSGRITGNSNPLVSQPINISRKNSISSISSRGKSTISSLGRLGTGSTSSINLSRSPGYSPLATVDEKAVPFGGPSFATSDAAIQSLENEMIDIRKRRAEVVARYEARLEFLRAKLKGAEMHEKLLKR